MKKLFVLLLVFVMGLSLIPVAHASSFQDKGMMVFEKSPEVYINTSNNQSFNVSFAYVIVKDNGQSYFFPFNSEKWTFKHISANESVYSAKLKSSPFTSGMGGGMYYNLSGLPGKNLFQKNLDVNITLTRTEELVPNTTSRSSSLSITIDISSNSFEGHGNLSLYQFVAGMNDHKQFNSSQYRFENQTGNKGYMSITGESKTGESKTVAYYWWPGNYSINGQNAIMESSIHQFMRYSVVGFTYSFDNAFRIVQDPFFSVPSFNILNHTVVYRAISAIGNFIYEHAEFLGGGLATGMVFLGMSYAYYRKKRI